MLVIYGRNLLLYDLAAYLVNSEIVGMDEAALNIVYEMQNIGRASLHKYVWSAMNKRTAL